MSRKPKSVQNDTSKTPDTIVSQVETSVLHKHNLELGTTIDKLQKLIEEKDAEISHLKHLLQFGEQAPIIGQAQKIDITDEEAIAEHQLFRLKQKAMNGELTLEEVKKFDLLVKNKRLAQGNATVIPAEYKTLPTSKKELIKLATYKDVSSDDNGEG